MGRGCCERPTYQELCICAVDLNGRIGILARSAAILLSFGGLLFTGISRKTTDIGSESSQHISAGFQSTFDRSFKNRLSLTYLPPARISVSYALLRKKGKPNYSKVGIDYGVVLYRVHIAEV